MEEGERVTIILSNDYTYSGTIISEDDFFIVIKDRYHEIVSIGKKDIQIIKPIKRLKW